MPCFRLHLHILKWPGKPAVPGLLTRLLFAALLGFPPATAQDRGDVITTSADAPGTGVLEARIPVTHHVSYRLPLDGVLPKTYRVTLAAAPKADPDWLVSTFVAGAPRTVTAENQGLFTESWDGLDDNYLPVPPGDYVIRGIYMPAQQWHMDKAYHSLTARYIAGVGDSWSPPPTEDHKFPWIFGHCSGYLRDVDVAENGMAAFHFHSIKNAWNPFLVDLNDSIHYDQVREKYASDGVGGAYTACDGEFVWVAAPDSEAPYVYRTDRQWGNTINKYGVRSVALELSPSDLCAWHDKQRQMRFVYITLPAPVNRILLYDGIGAALLDEFAIHNPRSVVLDKAAAGSRLYVLHQNPQELWQVSAVPLDRGAFAGRPETVLILPDISEVLDFDVDSKGAVYLAVAGEDRIRRVDPVTGTSTFIGKTPTPGRYDKRTLYGPQRVTVWRDERGCDSLLVVENGGPGRLSEWSPEGELLRDWFFAHTALYGYTLDPRRPEHLYHVSNGGNLIRYHLDYKTASWQVDSVWPMPIGGRMNPRIIYHKGHRYIAFAGGRPADMRYAIYRLDGDHCLPSAAVIPDESLPLSRQVREGFWWHDANGNARVEAAEFAAGRTQLPGSQYWGDQWLDDLSLVVFAEDGSFHRLAPSGFDDFGNPVYDGEQWQVLLHDPISRRRQEKKPLPLLYGGNEMPPFYGLHRVSLRGLPEHGFYVADSFGRSNPDGLGTAGNQFSQVKISRYLPNPDGGYRPVWRVGRKALRQMEPGEMYGAHHLTGEAHGMIGVFDSNGMYHVFTRGGLYVDTLGMDAFRHGLVASGMYAGGEEHWFGAHLMTEPDGAVYLCMGRAQMTVYEIPQWRPGLVQPLSFDQDTIRMTAGSIGLPNPIAASLRSGDKQVKLANFYPTTRQATALAGDEDWQVPSPVRFDVDARHQAEVRCKFDADTIHLRWQIRLPDGFEPVQVTDPARLFSREFGSDTFSFYIQGDPAAAPRTARARPGDLRIVFGIIKDPAGNVKPLAVGMYPAWSGPEPAAPVRYRSIDGDEYFEHVAVLDQVALTYELDPDKKGLRLTAAIPLTVIPGMDQLHSGFRTMVNFEATLGGHRRVWWANTDNLAATEAMDAAAAAKFYPGGWAQAQFMAPPPPPPPPTEPEP